MKQVDLSSMLSISESNVQGFLATQVKIVASALGCTSRK
uniref:Uncharacterized protein n=1 Tax=Arundo donax TaxID=35708 RepID=A0A0A8YDD0_ARUDO